MTFAEIEKRASGVWDDFRSPDKARILVGTGTCGKAAGAEETMAEVRTFLADEGLEAEVSGVGCLGLCFAELD